MKPGTDINDDPTHRILDARALPATAAAWSVTGIGLFHVVAAVAVAVGSVVVAAVAVARAPRPVAAAALGVCVAACGFAAAIAVRQHQVHAHALHGNLGERRTVEVTISADPHAIGPGPDGQPRWIAHADLRGGGRVTVFGGDALADLAPGTPARFSATISPPRPGQLEVATLTVAGTVHAGEPGSIARFARFARVRFDDAARRGLPTTEESLAPALVLGDTSGLPEDVPPRFQAAGLTHLMAVSGANVSVVCLGVLALCGVVGVPLWARVLAAAASVVGFVIVVHPSASVLRAAVMAIVGLAAIASSRTRHALAALCASVLVLLAVWPWLATDFGFALSVAATAAIVVWGPVATAALEQRRWPRPVAQLLAVTVCAQVATAPLIAQMTGTVSVVSLLANVAVTVVVPPITILGTIAAVIALAKPEWAALVLRVLEPELWWVDRVSAIAARSPGAVIAVPGGVPGAALLVAVLIGLAYVLSRRVVRLVGAIVMVGALAVTGAASLRAPPWPPPGWAMVVCAGGHPVVFNAGDGHGLVVGDTESDCVRRIGVEVIPVSSDITVVGFLTVSLANGVVRVRCPVGEVTVSEQGPPTVDGRTITAARTVVVRATEGKAEMVG